MANSISTGPLSDLERLDLATWSVKRRNLRGEPFTIIPPLIPLYRDQSPIVYIEKAAQLFISEYLVNLALFAADTKWGGRGIALYYFPATSQLQDFSATRIDPVIFYSPYLAQRQRYAKELNSRAQPKQNVGLKQLGEGAIYFRGAKVRNQMISVDADVVLFDEIDRMVEGTIEAGKRRTDSSLRPFIRGASTPELPERGVDLLIKQSTHKAWIVTCYSCKHKEDLSHVHKFIHRITKKTKESLLNTPDDNESNGCHFHQSDEFYIGCPNCHRLINVWNGLWVPMHSRSEPNIDHEGYHLPKLFSNRISRELLNEIGDKVEKEQSGQLTEAKTQEFYNSILGLPRAPQGTQLDLSQIEAAARPDPFRFFLRDSKRSYYADLVTNGPRRCFMGIDVGSRRLHVNVLAFPTDNDILSRMFTKNLPTLVFTGYVDDYPELDILMRQYQVSRAVIDHMPERRPASEFAKRWPGRVYLGHYPNSWTPQKGLTIYQYADEDGAKGMHKGEQFVAIGRTEVFDLVFEYIIKQQIILPSNVRQIGGPIDEQGIGDFCRHIMALTRVINDKGQGEYINQGDDHLAHALAYAFVAARLSVLDATTVINPSDALAAMMMFSTTDDSFMPPVLGSFTVSSSRKGGFYDGGRIRSDGLIRRARSGY